MSKSALVTGGTRGIGAGIAVAMRDAGYDVAVNYNSDDAVAAAFSAETGIAAFKWDVSDFAGAEAGYKAYVEKRGPVEVLVNNAGTAWDARFENMTEEQWHRVLRVNLDSVFVMSRLVYPDMVEKKWGRIINI
ncbi:MAG: SDR family NAD(P)-dependent oxidoreductase, partial [Alphaproteobacteria bacterium]|nr:SDR family NAD(P)-dependent oxidoreductase [Alphaproteobacteria bacterium]